MKSRTLIQSMVLLAAALLIPFRLFGQFASFNDQAFLAQGGGNSLLTGLVAAWHFDEQVTSGNRVDAASGITWYDFGNNVGSLRGVIGGAVSITNVAGQYLAVTNSRFQGTSGFTLSFWVIGANANNSWIGQKKADGSAADWFVDGSPRFQVVSGGVGKTINLTLPAGVLWNFIVVGFDGTQIFASVNGAAKTTLACPSVDVTANMPFLNRWILGGVDEVNFWSRALSSSEITTLYNSGFGDPYPYTQTDSGVLYESNFGWAATNAGVTVGNTSSNVLVGLIDGCVADGTWSGLSYCLPFVPDNLTAALLPLVAPKAQDQNVSWTYPVNHGFVSGDLSVSGLTGNGTSKYLDTTLKGNAIFTSTSSGVIIYGYTANSVASTYDLGYTDNSGANQVALRLNNGGTTTGVLYDSSHAASVAFPGNGFFSLQRTDSSHLSLYWGNSGNAHAQVASATTTTGAPQGQSIYLFVAFAYEGGAPFGFVNNTLSTVILSTGLGSSDDAKVFSRVQAFRTALGGGFR